MFETFTKTSEDLDREAAEGRSPEEIASLRLAAILYLSTSVLSLLSMLVLGGGTPPLTIVIGLGIAWYLYKLRPRAEAFALGLAVVGAIVAPLSLLRNGPAVAVLGSFPSWGFCTAIALLLTGPRSPDRRLFALVVFCVFTIGITLLLLLWRLAPAAAQLDG